MVKTDKRGEVDNVLLSEIITMQSVKTGKTKGSIVLEGKWGSWWQEICPGEVCCTLYN